MSQHIVIGVSSTSEACGIHALDFLDICDQLPVLANYLELFVRTSISSGRAFMSERIPLESKDEGVLALMVGAMGGCSETVAPAPTVRGSFLL